MDSKKAEKAAVLISDLKKYAAIGYGKVTLTREQVRLLREYSGRNWRHSR